MMQALIKVHPEWADAIAFEQARAKMLSYGLSIGLIVEDLFSMTAPEAMLSLWTATLAAEQDLWE
jgi:hypothetical protein